MTLPLGGYQGTIVLVPAEQTLEDACAEMSRETHLGFDTESRPSFKPGQNYPVSVVQLGGKSKVWVIQTHGIDLDHLAALMSNPAISKIGVAVQDDVRRLRRVVEFEPAGIVELGVHTRQDGIQNTGLRALVAHYLGFRISKAAQTSNWANKVLSPQQVRYAATDAWACREIYFRIHNKKTSH